MIDMITPIFKYTDKSKHRKILPDSIYLVTHLISQTRSHRFLYDLILIFFFFPSDWSPLAFWIFLLLNLLDELILIYSQSIDVAPFRAPTPS